MDKKEYMEKTMSELSDFRWEIRKEALSRIARRIKEGGTGLKKEEQKPWVNLHLHTFHSFNYKNWSPSRVVFEGWKTGLKYVGTVDFDTLAALEETLFAGSLLGIPAAGGFETRVYIEEMKDVVINSPREPGIYYLCGKGFKKAPGEGSGAGRLFASMRDKAQRRNKQVLERLNGYLPDVELDYEKDVMSLTPSSNPTERHIIEAYLKKSEEVYRSGADRFWAAVLNEPEGAVTALRTNRGAEFRERLRKTLIKYGGPGYVTPENESFPLFEEIVGMIEEAGGIPTGTWLDGTNQGEAEPAVLLEFLMDRGIRAMTVIPDRNYNISDPDERKTKLEKLDGFIAACREKEMPVVCGTEMNKHGQPFVDDFDNPAIAPYLPDFLSGASVFM